jgi:alkaline phosphatase D
VATEFVGTSISSHGVPYQEFLGFLPDNPHVRYFDSRSRGYAFVELTPEKLTTRFEAVDDATDPRSASSTLETFVVESGRPGPQLA